MGYKFNQRFCTVEIEENTFHVVISKQLIDGIKKSRDDINALKGKSSDDSTVCAAVDKAIDSVLGKTAAAKIFEGRELFSLERLDVLAYIYGEISKSVGVGDVWAKT